MQRNLLQVIPPEIVAECLSFIVDNDTYYGILCRVTKRFRLKKRVVLFKLHYFFVNIDMLQWARENGYQWNENSLTAAVRSENLDVIQWATFHNCPLTSKAFAVAACNGDLQVLNHLLFVECPWSARVCESAKNLEILNWLRSKGCPWRWRCL